VSATTITTERRRVSDACLSDLILDQLALDELDETGRARALAHLAACAPCTAARAALEADRQAFLAQVDVPTLAADARVRATAGPRPRPAARPGWSWTRLWAPLAIAGGLGAAALALVPFGPGPGVRTKGAGFSLAASVQPRGAAPGTGARPHAGEPLHAGDHLQLEIATDDAGYLIVAAVDARGTVSTYFPPGPVAERVDRGRAPLRTAVELDDTAGREIIVGLLCADPLPTARALEAVGAAVTRAGGSADVGAVDLPCRQTRYVIDKAAPEAPRR
jgi:hypothetical protein